jgi:hypothetical protein
MEREFASERDAASNEFADNKAATEQVGQKSSVTSWPLLLAANGSQSIFQGVTKRGFVPELKAAGDSWQKLEKLLE